MPEQATCTCNLYLQPVVSAGAPSPEVPYISEAIVKGMQKYLQVGKGYTRASYTTTQSHPSSRRRGRDRLQQRWVAHQSVASRARLQQARYQVGIISRGKG